MKRSLLSLILVSGLSLSAFNAQAADDSLLYVGGAIGDSEFNESGWGSDSWSGYGVFIGTGLLPILDVEAGYMNFGDFSPNVNDDNEVDTLYAAARFAIDVGPVNVFAKAGVHTWSISNDGRSGIDDFDKDDTDLMYGVGANFQVTDLIGIGATYTRFELNDYSDVDMFAATVTFSF